MSEVKVVLAPNRILQEADHQDYETLQTMKNEPTFPIYLESDDSDHFISGADGNVTRVRCFSINGVQFFVPVQVMYQVPKTLFEFIQQCNDRKNSPRRKPGLVQVGRW